MFFIDFFIGMEYYVWDAFSYFLNPLSILKELCDVKRKNAALQMQQFVGEEQNDLLDYLRSLQPEKVLFFSFPFLCYFSLIFKSISRNNIKWRLKD